MMFIQKIKIVRRSTKLAWILYYFIAEGFAEKVGNKIYNNL